MFMRRSRSAGLSWAGVVVIQFKVTGMNTGGQKGKELTAVLNASCIVTLLPCLDAMGVTLPLDTAGDILPNFWSRTGRGGRDAR